MQLFTETLNKTQTS